VPPGAAEVIANGPAARLLQRGGKVTSPAPLPARRKVARSPTSCAAICEILD